MKIYLICETKGEEAHAKVNNRPAAEALKSFGFRECTKKEYEAMSRKLLRLETWSVIVNNKT